MTSAQHSDTPSDRLDELLALRERLTRDLKLSKGGKGKAEQLEQAAPLDYAAAFSLVLDFATSVSTVAASLASKSTRGPVPTTAAFEALELLLRRALAVLTLDLHPSELATVHSTLSPAFLRSLTTVLYTTWEQHLPSAQQRIKASLVIVLSLASPSVLDVPQVVEQLKDKVIVDRWDSRRTLHTFETLLPYGTVEDFEKFAIGQGGAEEGVTRRFTQAIVANEEMAQLVGKVALVWLDKCWARAGATEPHLFWIRPSLEACRTGGPKARHSISTYILQPAFTKRKDGFRAMLSEMGFLAELSSGALGQQDEESLETALSVLKAANALNLVELDGPSDLSPDSPKVALPPALLPACLTHSSISLRISALSLLVLAPSTSIAFPSASFPLLRTFYTYSLGEEDGEMKMSTVSFTGKLLLRLRDSAWKAQRLSAKPGKAGAAEAAEYVQRVKEWMGWFLRLISHDNLSPARPFRLKINSLRMLDLAFQAKVDARYSAELPTAGTSEEGASGTRSTTTGYSSYRRTATTQTPMFHAKHRKLEARTASSDASPSSHSASPPSDFSGSTPAAPLDESGWPFSLDLVTPETTQILLQQLLSTYTALRFLSISMLERFPAPLPGYPASAEGADKAKQELFLPALRMIRSGREAEASAGAGVVGLVWRKWVFEALQNDGEVGRWNLGELGGWQESVETRQSPAGFSFISSLLDLASQQLSHYSSDLSTAASVAPVHGTLLALRHLFISIPTSSYEALSTPTERRTLFHRALAVIKRVWEVTSPVLAAKAPEGTGEGAEGEADTEEARAIRFEQGKKAAEGEAEAEDDGEEIADGTGGPQHKIILSACWRAMKEAGELLETILRLPSELGTASFQAVWSYNEIRDIGDLFSVWLARIRHRGAFMAVHPCYTRAAAALLVAGKEWAEVGKLPEEWLDSHLNAIISKRISFTRRSAGIPYLILGLLLTILPSSRSTFDRAFTRLFEIAESTTRDISDESRVHAINTVRTVFLDAKGGLAAAQFVERGFLVSISLFFSPNWILRNVAMMLFASLVTRALNARRTNLDRDPENLARRLSVEEFFGRYPALKTVLRDELERGWNESLAASSSSTLNSSLFSILMLLSLLQTPKRIEGTSDASLPAPFVPLVKACAKSRVWKIREVAGDALTGLVAPNDVGAAVEELLVAMEREVEQLDDNELHGRLLQALSLLESAELLKGPEAERVSAVYLRLAPTILTSTEDRRRRRPFAVLTAFLSISLRLPSTLRANEASAPAPFALSALVHAESWDAAPYHLPSAEEFLRVSWKVVYTAAANASERSSLIAGGLNGRSLEVKRVALEELALLIATFSSSSSPLAASTGDLLLRVVLDDTQAGDVRVSAANLLPSLSTFSSTATQSSFSALATLYEQTPNVPLREAVLPVLAAAAAAEEEQKKALELIDSSSKADESVETREAAGLALVALSRTVNPPTDFTPRLRTLFAKLTLRMLQDDDVTVRSYAHEASGLRLVEGKAVEAVVRDGGHDLQKAVAEEQEDDLQNDLDLLANPSSLLFAIEKPNIFLDPFLVPSLSGDAATGASDKLANKDRLEQAIQAGKALKEGPLGRGGNELVAKWEGLLGTRE